MGKKATFQIQIMNIMRMLMASIIIVFISLFFPACRTITENSLANQWIDALNHHDTNAIAKMYDDSATIESPNWEGVKTGPDEIRTIYRRYFSSTPDLTQKITHVLTSDSCVVIEYDSWGTLQNPEKLTPDYMRGKKYLLHNCTRMSLNKGKIMRQQTFFDQVSFLRQMGFFEER
jgi:steroid delta-isomerase-like uncharacterized protein